MPQGRKTRKREGVLFGIKKEIGSGDIADPIYDYRRKSDIGAETHHTSSLRISNCPLAACLMTFGDKIWVDGICLTNAFDFQKWCGVQNSQTFGEFRKWVCGSEGGENSILRAGKRSGNGVNADAIYDYRRKPDIGGGDTPNPQLADSRLILGSLFDGFGDKMRRKESASRMLDFCLRALCITHSSRTFYCDIFSHILLAIPAA